MTKSDSSRGPDCNTVHRRAQIGASTIIILIAALLIAATTAGVLVNVTGFLQTEASESGQSVSAEVRSPIRFAAVTGQVNQTTPRTLNETRITVALDGSTPIDLDDATVRLETAQAISTLVYDPAGPEQGTSFGVDPVVDVDGTAPTLTDSDDRFAIVLDTPQLEVGDSVMIRLSLETGASQTVRFRVPARIESADRVTLR